MQGGGGGGGRKRNNKVSKTGFPKKTPNYLGYPNRWFLAIFSYLLAITPLLGPFC